MTSNQYLNKIYYLIEQHRLDEAIDQLQQLKAIPEIRNEATYLLGVCYMKKGWFVEAKRAFEICLNETTKDDRTLKNRIVRQLSQVIKEIQ